MGPCDRSYPTGLRHRQGIIIIHEAVARLGYKRKRFGSARLPWVQGVRIPGLVPFHPHRLNRRIAPATDSIKATIADLLSVSRTEQTLPSVIGLGVLRVCRVQIARPAFKEY